MKFHNQLFGWNLNYSCYFILKCTIASRPRLVGQLFGHNYLLCDAGWGVFNGICSDTLVWYVFNIVCEAKLGITNVLMNKFLLLFLACERLINSM